MKKMLPHENIVNLLGHCTTPCKNKLWAMSAYTAIFWYQTWQVVLLQMVCTISITIADMLKGK